MPHNTTSAHLLLEVAALKVTVGHLSAENDLLRNALMRYGSGTLALRQVDRMMKARLICAAELSDTDRPLLGEAPDLL